MSSSPTANPAEINPVALKTIRALREYTLRDLGERTGQDPGFLSRLESGKRGASGEVLERLADALHVHVGAITCPAPPPPAPPRPRYSVALTDQQVAQLLADHAALGGAA